MTCNYRIDIRCLSSLPNPLYLRSIYRSRSEPIAYATPNNLRSSSLASRGTTSKHDLNPGSVLNTGTGAACRPFWRCVLDGRGMRGWDGEGVGGMS